MGKSRINETRDNTARETESRATTAWKPPSMLDAPPAREGMTQRWIATSILGKDNSGHVMRRVGEGWEPRPKQTVPDNYPVPTMDYGDFKGCIGVEGMILCEMPDETVAQRNAHYRGLSNKLMSATVNEISRADQNTSNMRLSRDIDHGSEGGGRVLTPMED